MDARAKPPQARRSASANVQEAMEPYRPQVEEEPRRFQSRKL
jgi:hypothetical protein